MLPATKSEFVPQLLRNAPPPQEADTGNRKIAAIVNGRTQRSPTAERISVRHLDFYYEDGNQALRDITVPIYDKRVTAFMGPSGCGKSTLLRVFNRMHDLYPGQRANGEVLFDGKNILGKIDACQLRARIGMVFQKPTPFPMSIYDNIAFGIRLHREVGKKEMDGLVESALRRAALWDEVEDDLMRRTIDELRHEHAIVLVTHNLQQAARVVDFVGFMYLGEVLEFGSIQDIFLRPKEPRTERFITGRFG